MLKLRHIFLILLGTVSGLGFVNAQNLGNEWIVPGQKYYRLSIPETGMYRVTIDELANLPLGDYSLKQIQLFYKGEEIPCYIEGESTENFQFIEFYAEKNDGWFDVGMYDEAINQSNPNYSFINDTASVFITWGSSLSNKRYQLVNDSDYADLTPLSYCFKETLEQYTNQYYLGPTNCEYTQSEGWAEAKFGLNSERTSNPVKTKTIQLPDLYKGSVKASFKWGLISVSTGFHHLKTEGVGYENDSLFGGYANVKGAYSVASNELTESNELTFTIIDDMEAPTDFLALSYIQAQYPSLFKFNDESHSIFKLPNAGSAAYIEASGFNHHNSALLFDIKNQKRIITTIENDVVKAKVPQYTEAGEFVLTSTFSFKQVKKAEIHPAAFTDFRSIDKSFVILTNSTLINSQGVKNYADYRDAFVVNVDELYNQFAYGIQKHPLAIRNFTTYILNNAKIKPEYLYIIGKGVSASGANDFAGYRKNSGAYKNCFIPPMGNPASDILLTAKTDGVSPLPALAMGRLSALTNQQVLDYLQKVRDFEANDEPEEWMKHGIHFGGGGNAGEQARFEGYLRGYENYFEDTLFGGEISTFVKSSSDPIEISQSDSVDNLINGGVSIMTFFGHGSSGGFDQNIDEPNQFTNYGKYPLLVANSCYTGNIFFPGQFSTSEDWVLIANKGVIGFLAMSHQGVAPYLNTFTNRFYYNFCSQYYGEPLGKIINQTRRQVLDEYNNNYINTIQEFTLHGDPKVVLNSFDKPDLIIERSSLSLNPSILTTQVDSFDLKIVAKNIARAVADTFVLNVSRTLPQGSVIDTQIIINGLNYKKDIIVRYPIDRVNGIGVNTFFVSIDAGNEIDEFVETNNSFAITTYISSVDLVATIPYEYSMEPAAPYRLKAITGDPFAPSSESIFQLDTSAGFDSPFKVETSMIHEGGVVKWDPEISYLRDEVYYWRVGKPGIEDDVKWSSSSFCIKNRRKGWIQSDFDQLDDNNFTFIEPDINSNQFNFITTPKSLSCHNVGTPNSSTWGDVKYAIDEITDYNCCGAGAAMLLVVIDTLNLKPWESDHGDYGHRNYPKCPSRGRNDLYFVFNGNNAGLANLADVVDNVVPEGYYILIYSFNRIEYQALYPNIVDKFEEWGAANFRFLQDFTPYIFFTQKGNPSVSEEVFTESTSGIIDLDVPLKTNFYYGSIESSLIGPSQDWKLVEWSVSGVENNSADNYYLSIHGINSLGKQEELYDSITEKQIDISSISTDEYPYLKLDFFTLDETNKTPAQLRSWSVQYTPLTDLAINPQKGFDFYADTLQEGDIGKMEVAIENIGAESSDSILISYWLQDSKNTVYPLPSHRVRPLLPGGSVMDTISFKTLNHSGLMSLWMNINPVSSTGEYDQPEQNFFNNVANKVFFIEQDKTNPLLDVTFDGMHIMDGDIVSARPVITVQLKDENQYIALDDTSTFSLYLKSQQTGIESKVPLGNSSLVSFIPAELPKNKAQLIYQPEFTEDGIYELRVRGKDGSGNASGSFDYQISFQVITESTITNVFNYPNPFSTSTRFVFELTGSEIPDEIRIDILTVTGKVVKIIYQDDLGAINIGKNISNYAWDGRDMYGDPLANGVYFYKVSARINGEEIKHRNTSADNFFKNGFGKMYIMR